MQLSAKELANLLDGRIEGDPEAIVDRPSKIEEGGPGSISFLGNEKYETYVYTTDASILLVNKSFIPRRPFKSTLIRVDNVYAAIASLLEIFNPQEKRKAGISPQAVVAPDAELGTGVYIGPASVVETGARLGNDCVIHAQVYIGEKVVLGTKVTLFPGVRIYAGCTLGDNCIVHANTVIGSDGFGFAPQKDGTYTKINQIGNVIIEDNVEIGANAAIDRATMGTTIIRAGVKLDNLVHIGHNVEVGENTVIAAQTGIAGSTKIGKNCLIGGQVGVAGHVNIANGTRIQAQSGVASSIEQTNTSIFGYPAFGYRDYIRSYAVFRQLPDLYKRLYRLEKQLQDMEKPLKKR